MAPLQKNRGRSSQNTSVPAQDIPCRHLSHAWPSSAINHCSQYRQIVLVLFQLRCKDMFKQFKACSFPQCSNGSIPPPGKLWKPVPGGLSSDAEFQTNIRKFNDPNDSMTRLMVFGVVGANNAGRAADKAARQVGCLIKNYPQTGCESASRHYLSFFPFLSSKLMIAIQYNGLTDRRRVGMPTGGARGREGRTARCKETASSTGRYHKSAGDC